MNPSRAEISNWQLAEIVYSLRLLIDRIERRSASDADKEIVFMAYRALQNTPDAVIQLVDELERGNQWENYSIQTISWQTLSTVMQVL